MKQTIFVTRMLPQVALDKLAEHFLLEINQEDRALTKEEIIKGIQNKAGLLSQLTDPIDKTVIDAAKELKVISNYAVGFNNIDIKEATLRKIPVCNTPGILTNATADLAFTLILAVARHIIEADSYVRKGLFTSWHPSMFLGTDLSGKTLGIVGLGRIGQAVAKRARGFDMNVIYYSRKPVQNFDAKYVSLNELIEISDIISLHTPLTPETQHLIGEKEFNKMKKTALLINTTRGPVVDEKALVQALKTKRIAGAGLDVYEEEPKLASGLAELKNTVLLPHIGSATIETRTKMAMMAAENIIAVLSGQKPAAMVNPEVFAMS
jgi:glyoxylate reductase